jgi:rare lipoprotein A
MRWRLVLGIALLLAGCRHKAPPPPPPPPVSYVLEPAWQAGDAWFYPHETFDFDGTGIAAVMPADHDTLTTDNETYDPDAMAAAMQAVQLPAIATVTNLETGLAVTVRVNDRGPADPGRLIAVTPRVAQLLGMTGPAARVRVTFDPQRSAALAHQLLGHSADLAIAAAPQAGVQQSDLAPLAGTAQESTRQLAARPAATDTPEAPTLAVPLHLPEQVTQSYADPGTLMIDAGSFTHESAARIQIASMPDANARLIRSRAGGQTTYTVRAGPYPTIDEADAALAAMLRDGVTSARIVVDLP